MLFFFTVLQFLNIDGCNLLKWVDSALAEYYEGYETNAVHFKDLWNTLWSKRLCSCS